MKKLLLLAVAMALIVGVGGTSKATAAMTGLEGHSAYIYTVVRVTTQAGGGSGTVVYSMREDPLTETPYVTFIITNHHVIASAITITDEWDSAQRKEVKVERRAVVYVELFKYRNVSDPTGTLKVEADIVAYSETNDLALLKLRLDDKVEYVANLPYTDKKYDVLDESISVGCSLLFPPLPAVGNISRKNMLVDSLPYDMSTSQIIFGNSGGAMFLSDGTWIGVPSRVAAAGWYGTPVPHMGLFIPFRRVYEWLKSEHYDFIYADK